MRKPLAIAALLAVTLAAGCGSGANGSSGSDDRTKVVTAFYPLHFLTERIGGGRVTVTDLTKPGAEPHDLELNPQQVGQISDAGLIVYLSGFQPAVDEAVTQQAKDKAFDAATAVELLEASGDEHGHEGEEEKAEEHAKDPHIWLDPLRFATVADKLGERLAQADAKNAATYRDNARALHTELDKLHNEYATKLKTCQRRDIVTSHTAFAYLASRYDLHEVGITGLSPEAEATPQRMAEVSKEAKEHGATTIFFETLVSPKVAEAVASEVGAKTAVLDPIEGKTKPDADYFSMMRQNLSALTEALGCSA